MEQFSLPPEFPDESLGERVRVEIAASGRKVVAIDDDPTGVQTVHDIDVLTEWSERELELALRQPESLFFVLTNSRSLPAARATAINTEIVSRLAVATRDVGIGFVIASRSDSTLRGHFPAETDAIAAALGGVDAVLIVPAFFEAGRYTIGDIHWVMDQGQFRPASETEFAKDRVFGYRSANLREWVAEKTRERIPAADVASLSLTDIRQDGPERVAAQLMDISGDQPVIVNAASYRDLEVVALGVLAAERAGKRFIYRTAASFVRVRAGQAERPLLTRREIFGSDASGPLPGLVVVGSHVRRSTEQLVAALELPIVVGIELAVPDLLGGVAARAQAIARASAAADRALAAGQTPILFTSREVHGGTDGGMAVGQAVSGGLVETVQRMTVRPGWVIGKGGITSSDIGTAALGVRRARVRGQILPGIPIWQLGPESRFPQMPYAVFPGNVGDTGTLAEAIEILRGSSG